MVVRQRQGEFKMLKEFLPVERVRRKIDNHHFLSATHQGGWRASMKHDYGKPRSAAAKPVRVHGVDTGAADFVRRKRTAVIKRVLYLTIFLVVLVGGLGYFQPPSTEIRGWASCAIVMGPLAILAATRDGCCERPPPPIAMWTEGCEQRHIANQPLLDKYASGGDVLAQPVGAFRGYQEYV